MSALGLAALLGLSQACAQGVETETGTSTVEPTFTTSETEATTETPSTTEGPGTSSGTTADPSAGDTPGITVDADVFVVSEAGDTAQIYVVLDSMPSADVTVTLASSDEDEGAVDPASLTFTPDDWDQPQSVTVSGVDDGEPDGEQPFTVEISPAESDDSDYAGLDPDDLEFTNEDLYVHVFDTTLEDSTLAVGWGCDVLDNAGDLLLQTTQNGQPRWELRIGAGGSLTQIRDVPADMMIPATPLLESGPSTEFITQWTSYSSGVKYDHPALIDSDDAYHINQAGSSEGVYSPTISVDVDEVKCIVDVYSVPERQWYSELDPFIDGKLSQRTRYKVFGQGRVFVRRTVLIGTVVLEGETVDLDMLNLSTTHYIDVDPFAHLAVAVNDAGLATQFDNLGDVTPQNNVPVAMTSGYIALLDVNNLVDGKVLGLVYGANTICGASKTGCKSMGSHTISKLETAGQYVRFFPTLRLNGITEGAIVDWSTVLLMQSGTSPVFGGDILNYNDVIGPPVVIPPDGVAYPETFNDLAAALADNLSANGTETDQLGPLAGV